jgi:large subunit ribosomal protein L22
MEAVAKLKNYPTSPRKMRLLADLIRGHRVERVLAILEHNPKHPAVPLRKLVLSAINNWKQKNESGDESELVVKTIFVDGARTLKRMRPAPQGRGYRIRKRSNHVTLVVDIKPPVVDEEELEEEIEEQLEELVETQDAEETKTKKSRKPAKSRATAKEEAKKTPVKRKTTKKTK